MPIKTKRVGYNGDFEFTDVGKGNLFGDLISSSRQKVGQARNCGNCKRDFFFLLIKWIKDPRKKRVSNCLIIWFYQLS